MLPSVILFRNSLAMEGEQAICAKHMPVFESRTSIPKHRTVIGRYSTLPYYEELQQDLQINGCQLINSTRAYAWVADVMAWSLALEGLTPRSWDGWSGLPATGSFVLKGRTNSRKHQWRTHMFAANRAEVPLVAARLMDDSLIREQGIIVREYLPLRTLGVGINDLPITNEWRTFWLVVGGQPHLLSKGFYWQASHPELEAVAVWTAEAETLCHEAVQRIQEEAPELRFFVLDVAQLRTGAWTIIEINDGQMSGLCGCVPEALYAKMAQITMSDSS